MRYEITVRSGLPKDDLNGVLNALVSVGPFEVSSLRQQGPAEWIFSLAPRKIGRAHV